MSALHLAHVLKMPARHFLTPCPSKNGVIGRLLKFKYRKIDDMKWLVKGNGSL